MFPAGILRSALYGEWGISLKKRDKGLAREIALQAGLRMGILSLALFLTFGLVHLVQEVRQLLLDPLDTAAARLERKLSDGPLVLVWDQGFGIPPEEQGRVFDRFYRGVNRTAGPGEGLGLAIARQLSEVLDAPVQLESTGPEGSLFSLRPPAAE